MSPSRSFRGFCFCAPLPLRHRTEYFLADLDRYCGGILNSMSFDGRGGTEFGDDVFSPTPGRVFSLSPSEEIGEENPDGLPTRRRPSLWQHSASVSSKPTEPPTTPRSAAIVPISLLDSEASSPDPRQSSRDPQEQCWSGKMGRPRSKSPCRWLGARCGYKWAMGDLTSATFRITRSLLGRISQPDILPPDRAP